MVTCNSSELDVVADYIISNYEDRLLIRIININYCYFTAIEKKDIFNISKVSLKNSTVTKNLIMQDLNEFLETESELYIEGFINFRMKNYINELGNIVDNAVDSYLVKCEYNEFIELLKYIVSLQPPKFETVHVFWGGNGKYSIFDDCNKEITSECIQDFLTEMPINDKYINYDDLLISSLITLSPTKLYLHSLKNFINLDLLNTIESVFQNRVIICD